MLSGKKYVIKVDNFHVFPVLTVFWPECQQKFMILALTLAISLRLVVLKPAETSLMPWLYGNGFIKRALFLALADILRKNI